MRNAAALAFALVCLVASTVGAQTPGLRLDQQLPALDDGPMSLAVQPAGLAFRRGAHTALALESTSDSPAFGVGWYNSVSTGRGLGMGIGGEWASSPFRSGAFTLGFAAGGPHAAIGWTRRAYRRDAFEGATVHDVGFLTRPSNVFALSVVTANLTAPRIAGVLTHRVHTFAIGARTPDGRLEGDVGTRVVETDGLTEIMLDARLRVVDGFGIFAMTRLATRGGFELSRAGAGVQFAAGPLTQRVGTSSAPPGTSGALSWISSEFGVPFGLQNGRAHDTLLRIDLAGDIPESPPFRLFGSGDPTATDLIATLDRVAREDDMGGVYVWLGGLTAGGAQLWEIREALQRVRESGKLVVAYLERGTVRDLYMASVADYVIASPTLAVLDAGLSTTRTYLAELLEHVGIEAQFVRIAEYKSSPERFTRSGPSDESNEQLDAFLDDVWPVMRGAIGEATAMTADEVDAWLSTAPLFPRELIAAGLVDESAYRDEVSSRLRAHFDRSLTVSYAYGRVAQRDASWFPRARVAVIHITGSIVSGGGGFGILSRSIATGSAVIEETARALRTDGGIDAIVLRIDSPGGSAAASDDMQRALSRLTDGRPVYVSMADVAASGGYYVSAIDAPVYATPITLTGSIGIYAGTFAVDDLLSAVGVSRVRDDRGGHADYFDGMRWDDEELGAIERLIAGSYAIFLDRVATARSMTSDEVDAVGRGHIWSGTAALDAGLVDDLSGFPGVLDAIRDDLGLNDRVELTLVHYPERGTLDAPGLALAFANQVNGAATTSLSELVEGAGLSAPITLVELMLGSARGEAMAHTGFALGAW